MNEEPFLTIDLEQIAREESVQELCGCMLRATATDVAFVPCDEHAEVFAMSNIDLDEVPTPEELEEEVELPDAEDEFRGCTAKEDVV